MKINKDLATYVVERATAGGGGGRLRLLINPVDDDLFIS